MDSATQLITQAQRPQRRYRSIEEKRQIVEETLRPGASVPTVARARGINANLIFTWRKLYRAGLLQEPAASRISAEGRSRSMRLLPVTVREEQGCAAATGTAPKPSVKSETQGTSPAVIELSLAQAQIRIVGAVDVGVVRAVLESVLR
jgi:transposase